MEHQELIQVNVREQHCNYESYHKTTLFLGFLYRGDDTRPVEEGIIPYDMLLYTSQNYASISILYRKTTRKLAFCIANNIFLLVISIEKKYNITNKLVL